MTEWRVGTIGFGYDDWRGVFYPPSVKSNEQLAFYARHYDCVEIDSTFHAAPPIERFERWAEQTPDDFRFAIKTPRAITHDGVLADALEPLRSFVHLARPLGEKLGCVLIQYPPTLPGRAWPQVERLLGHLPGGVRYAVEFRHDDFFRDEVYAGLARLNVALVNAEYEHAPREPIATADFAFVRLIGLHGRYVPFDCEREDFTDRLTGWRDRLNAHATLRTAFVMLNNDYAGYAIATADRFKRLVGQPVASTPERMGTLF